MEISDGPSHLFTLVTEAIQIGLKILCAGTEFANRRGSLLGDHMGALFFLMGASLKL